MCRCVSCVHRIANQDIFTQRSIGTMSLYGSWHSLPALLLLLAVLIQLSDSATPLDSSDSVPVCIPQSSGVQCKSSYSKGPVISRGQCLIMQQCCRSSKDKCPPGTKLYYLGEIGTGNTPCYECL
ncbi:hypothetical protein BIW11_03048 [Tropilaelaps mercedesae]|uniref:Uncharacterized protein n=1 Tax=Tropilaelaps mercedesae TaxID=418985 RepID=A0A1V9XT15_9ACAR|nr:hypothetical protein BIW11_03048 [Tropilaelaps mercedesae]